jgi:DNA mismatch repair protein MutL
LLVPVHVAVDPGAAEIPDRHAGLLDRLGIELDCIAPDRIAVRAIPALLGDADAAALGAAVTARLRGQGVAVNLAELLPELLPERPCAGMDSEALAALLRGFESLDLDFGVASAPGFWRTLGAEDFARLLGKHGRAR